MEAQQLKQQPMYEGRRDYGETPKSNKIYVSNLSMATTEDDLRKHFEKYGQIGSQSVHLKQKESVTFAFIEFGSTSEAEEAVTGSNGQQLAGLIMKVQFARGERRNFGERGRGRSFGDRGGYQSRNFDGDRPPRRDFGDRPRGCFNCGEEGHMIKDCPQPRKPREFNNRDGGERRYNNREEGGDRRGGYGDRNERGGRDYNNRDEGRRGGYERREERRRSRSRSGDKGGRRGRSHSSS